MSKAAAALARRRWSKRNAEKVCPHCRQEFRGDVKQVYCTPAHQNAAAAKRHRDKNRAARAHQASEGGEG